MNSGLLCDQADWGASHSAIATSVAARNIEVLHICGLPRHAPGAWRGRRRKARASRRPRSSCGTDELTCSREPSMSSSQERSAAISFVERHGLWNDAEFEAAAKAEKLIEEQRLEVVRLSFPDQHGILRGKTVMAGDAAHAMRNGCTITTTLLAKDTSHRTVFPVFTAGGGFGMPEMEGGGDVLMIADPSTFRVLPWTPRTGWLLCDLHFADGTPVPLATRHLYRQALRRLADAGFDFKVGLEV